MAGREVVTPTEALRKEFVQLSRDIKIETVDCHVLDPKLCSVVVNALSDVESKWRMIGTYLHVKRAVLDSIEKNNRRNSTKCLEAVVQQWLNLNYNVEKFGMPTWQFAICAVSKGSGNNRLAMKLAKEFIHPWDQSKHVLSVSSYLGDPQSILNTPIEEDDVTDLYGKLAEGLAGRWAVFGLQLGLTHQAIQDIHEKLEPILESVTQVIDAGCQGKTMTGAAITWQKLAIAVDAPSGGNNPLLAKEIADEHRDPAYIKKHPPKPSTPTCVPQQESHGPRTVESSNARTPQMEESSNARAPQMEESSIARAPHMEESSTARAPQMEESRPDEDSSPPDEYDFEQIMRDFNPEVEADGIIRDKFEAGIKFLARKLGVKSSRSKNAGDQEFGHYHVNGTPDNPPTNRGYALIFTIEKFDEPTLARTGTAADTRNLEKTFQHLGYEVLVYKNEQCTARGVEQYFNEIRQKYISVLSAASNPHDSFVCCFSSHGCTDKDTGVEYIVPYDYNKRDAEPRIKLPQLCSMINAKNCPALAGKPKLFFVQACRGKELPRLVKAPKSNTDLDAITEYEEIHQDSDMLFSFSTRYSNKAARDTVDGSWYIQELCKLLQSDAAKRKDICTLMTELHRRVTANYKQNFGGIHFRQCPELTHTLRLAFYFYRQV